MTVWLVMETRTWVPAPDQVEGRPFAGMTGEGVTLNKSVARHVNAVGLVLTHNIVDFRWIEGLELLDPLAI